jgi:hypothetical protein
MYHGVTNKDGGPKSSLAVGRYLLLVTMWILWPDSPSPYHVSVWAKGSGVGCNVDWYIGVCREVHRRCRPVPSVYLSCSGSNRSHDEGYPCAAK